MLGRNASQSRLGKIIDATITSFVQGLARFYLSFLISRTAFLSVPLLSIPIRLGRSMRIGRFTIWQPCRPVPTLSWLALEVPS